MPSSSPFCQCKMLLTDPCTSSGLSSKSFRSYGYVIVQFFVVCSRRVLKNGTQSPKTCKNLVRSCNPVSLISMWSWTAGKMINEEKILLKTISRLQKQGNPSISGPPVIHRINSSILPEFIFASHVRNTVPSRKYAAALFLFTRRQGLSQRRNGGHISLC